MKKYFYLPLVFLILIACSRDKNNWSCKDHEDFAYNTGKGQGIGYLNFPVSDSYADIKTNEFINEIKSLGCYDEVEEEYQNGVDDGKMNPDPIMFIPN